jgi:hypothetical protein
MHILSITKLIVLQDILLLPGFFVIFNKVQRVKSILTE